jgi:RNA polymerase sigma factor (sigma-70 family)
VDALGNPLDERYEGAANEIGKSFRRFPNIDPADLDELVSRAAHQVAAHEARHGRLANVKSYLWKSFLNGIADLCDTNRYRIKLKEVQLNMAEPPQVFQGRELSDAISRAERHMMMRSVLETFDDTTKAIVRKWIEGHSSKEIAAMYQKTEGHINVLLCRVRKRMAESSSRRPGQVRGRSQA